MGLVGTLHSWNSGDRVFRSDLNGNFSSIRDAYNATAMLTDVARTVAVGHTYTATQVFTPGSGFGVDVTVGGIRAQAGGVDIAGTSTYRGHVLFSADNSYDIGASLATRPRTLYVGTSVVALAVQAPASSSLDLKAPSGQGVTIQPDGSFQWIFSGATPSTLQPIANGVSNVGGSSNRIGTFYGVTADLTGTVTAATGAFTTLSGNPNFSGSPTFSGPVSLANPTVTGTLTAAQITLSGSNPRIMTGSSSLVVRNVADTITLLSIGTNGPITVGSTTTPVDLVMPAGLATGTAGGFLVLTGMSGTPTGAALVGSMVWDSSANKLWIRRGSDWKALTPT